MCVVYFAVVSEKGLVRVCALFCVCRMVGSCISSVCSQSCDPGLLESAPPTGIRLQTLFYCARKKNEHSPRFYRPDTDLCFFQILNRQDINISAC